MCILQLDQLFFVHNTTHSHQNFPVRRAILSPNQQRRNFALAFVYILFIWKMQTNQTI